LDLCDEKGDLCGKIFADMGADVIKIEPPGGSSSRSRGPFFKGEAHPEKSLFWFAFNNNKRGITLNLETADGKDIFRRLAGKSDIILESFHPGYLDRLGLGYSALSAKNPRMIMTSITPFGQEGPYKDYKGTDMIAFALSGLMSDCGDPDRPPVQVSFPQAYMAAGTYGAEGTMIAVYERELSGKGQHVDLSAQASVTWFISEIIPFWTFLKQNINRAGGDITRKGGLRAPMLWKCKDGYISYLIQAGLPGAERNKMMAKWLEEEGLANQYIKTKDWFKFDWAAITKDEFQENFVEPLSKLFMRYTVKELYDQALKRVISLLPASTSKYLVDENAQLQARNFWVPVEHEELQTTITYPGPFITMSETPLKEMRRAPMIGEHNREVLVDELGFSQNDLIMFKQAGVI
jgi:benzylsuccinate CoA-transferase BbsE subunit